MPGAQDRWDQLAEPSVRDHQAPAMDPPRVSDRPERGSLADLRQRLEWLPAGHPSSPYDDDLTRKPPVARLKDLELPLHGNGAAANGAAAHHGQEPAGRGMAARTEVVSRNGSGAVTRGSDGPAASGGLATPDGLGTPGGLGAPGGLSTSDGLTATAWSGPAGWSDTAVKPGADEGSGGERTGAGTATDAGLTSGERTGAGTATDAGLTSGNRTRAADRTGSGDGLIADDRPGADPVTGTDSGILQGRPAPDDRIAPSAGIGRIDADPALGAGLRIRTDPGTGTDPDAAGEHGGDADRGGRGEHRHEAAHGGGAGRGADDEHRTDADHWPGAGPRPGAEGADDQGGVPVWSAPGPGNAAATTDWRSAADEAADTGGIGAVRWASEDDLSTTAEWSRTTGWGGAPGRDGPTGERGRPRDHGGAAKPEWAEPGPAMETGGHLRAGNGRGRPGDEPRPGLDGSWEWNGRYLAPDECQIADEALAQLRTAEGRNVFGSYGRSGLTPAMRRLEAHLEPGRLLPDTERYALLPADVFKERLADLILRHPDKPAEELPQEVPDGIRYAYIFEAEHYADAALQVHSRLKGQGFELEVRRNNWRNPEWKGIGTRWRDPAHDVVFEVQFHTAPSWEAQQRSHAAYRRIMDPATPPAERARLRAVQAQAAAAIPVPPRCTAIPDYRKEAL